MFAGGEFYHIYNRGVDKRAIFLDKFDYERFLQGMREFNSVDPIGSIYENSFLKDKPKRKEKGYGYFYRQFKVRELSLGKPIKLRWKI